MITDSVLYVVLLVLILLAINVILFTKIDNVNKKVTLGLIVILAYVILLNPIVSDANEEKTDN